jgi:hypothetical protein
MGKWRIFMENVIRAIESEINNKEMELSALRQSLDNLRGLRGLSSASTAVGADRISVGQFEGQSVGAAVRQFMQVKRSATLDEIREALDRGGIKWGQYPKRQVALAVANSPTVYTLKDGSVTLVSSR